MVDSTVGTENVLWGLWNAHWQDFLIRGLIGIAFGLILFFFPGISLMTFVMLFAAFAFVVGIISLLEAVTIKDGRWWVRIIEGLIGIAAAAAVIMWPRLTLLTFAIILAVYSLGSVTTAFVGAAGIFGAAALYGAVTGRDMTSLGGLLFAGLIGVVIASFANIFIGGGALSFWIGIVGTLLFTGLTAFDVQRIRNGRMPWIRSTENASVIGALALYLDFVNLFLMLLRVTGSRR